jgi:hypothetical protein
MTRVSKKEERRARCPKKRQAPAAKSGPKQDKLPNGFKELANAVQGDTARNVFVGTISHPGK